MNKEEILNKYIDLIDKGYCSDCNELNCIDNFSHTKITQAIKELQKELEEYKNPIRYFKYASKNVTDENKKLKDNWNKLKEWVNKQYDYYISEEDYIGGRLCFTDMKDKMQELEQGSDNNGKD